MKNEKILEYLDYINPVTATYQEWLDVGMALKQEGYSVNVWDDWSALDGMRYHQGECAEKWATFNGNETLVTGGTIYHLAIQNGYVPPKKASENYLGGMGWDDYIFTSPETTSTSPIQEPLNWNPSKEITKYLETLFHPDEFVCYVTESYFSEKENKWKPTAGIYSRTAGELLESLKKYSFEETFGTINPECGAWFCINPVDGQTGRRNDSVTDFRYALVESDTISIEQQIGIIHDLQLPVAVMVHSGNKSVHAIVKVDAGNKKEYQERVKFLFEICQKNGLKIDENCKNPSRLSRMAGVERGGKKQFIIEMNTGFSSWNEWKDFMDESVDNLPDFSLLPESIDDLPPLNPELIEGILRTGHKMMVVAPSKAGKSFLLMELCVAIATGSKWLGRQCRKGKILYINFELDDISGLHRFADICRATKANWQELRKNLLIWNMRGYSEPLTQLVGKLIRRAKKFNPIAIVLDPIYKVISGDENSASEMAEFCNQFDKICSQLNCASINCHHQSKSAANYKNSMNRASGSGVFARDPDALLDLSPIEMDADAKEKYRNTVACNIMMSFIKNNAPDLLQEIPLDKEPTRNELENLCHEHIAPYQIDILTEMLEKSDKKCDIATAWTLEGTLREFPPFAPQKVIFSYPIHELDRSGFLQSLTKKDSSKMPIADKSDDIRKDTLSVFHMLADESGTTTVKAMAETMGCTEKTIRNRIKEISELEIVKNVVKHT